MKKVILVLIITLIAFSCKKNNQKGLTSNPKVYCIFYNQTCVGCQSRVFYKCASTEAEMQKASIELRDMNKSSEVFEKSSCSECQ